MNGPAGPRKLITALALGSLLTMTAGCTDSDGGGSDEAFCAQLADTPALSTVIERFTNTSPGDLEQRLDEAAGAYADLRSSAPGAIDDEVDTLVDLVDAVIGAVRANPDDPVAAADQVRSVMADHPDAESASEAVTTYASTTCGIELATTTVPGA